MTMTYAVDSGTSGADLPSVCFAAQTPAGRPRASGLRAGGEFHLDGFGPVYLAPMPGGRAADRSMDDVSSLHCAAGAACAGGDFFGGVA
jgi:hypothetical protein